MTDRTANIVFGLGLLAGVAVLFFGWAIILSLVTP